MNILDRWAITHSVGGDAMRELITILSASASIAESSSGESARESKVQARMRLAAACDGGYLWRNNVGAGKLANGKFIRWGLCNESKEVNAICKSSDLIGIMPIKIEQSHVGSVIGQFTAIECKRAGWKYKGTAHEQAQLSFINIVTSCGGAARFEVGA